MPFRIDRIVQVFIVLISISILFGQSTDFTYTALDAADSYYASSDNQLINSDDTAILSFPDYASNLSAGENNDKPAKVSLGLNASFNGLTLPEVEAFAIQPSCSDNVPQSDGYLQISEAINGNRYHWSTGSTFDDNNGAKTYNNAVNLSGTYPVQFNTGLSNADAGNFTIRVYGDAADCFTDLVVSLNTQDCLVGCGCTDYVYLNDAPLSEVHKFEVLPDGSLSEIGSPWIGSTGNDPNQQPVRYPHGIATDVNGFVYVGDVDNFTNNGGGIVKLSCDGTVLEDRIPGPTNWGYNMDIVDNNLHIPGFNGVEIWDVCEGTQLGNLAYTEAPTNSWGFVIDVNEMYYYRTTGWVDGGTNKIIRGNLDGSGEIVLYDSGDNTGAYMGITQDGSGNLYVVQTAQDNGSGDATIVKVSSTGTLLATAPWDNNLTQIDGMTSGYYGARGIVWSPIANQLYVGSFEDCIAVFDTALNYLPGESVGYVTGAEPKGVSVSTECCPTSNNMVVDTTLCAAAVNDVYALQELINCNSTICEGIWQEGPNNNGITYDPCDNSLTIDALGACGSFSLESDGTGSTPQCGAFLITLNLCAAFTSDAPEISVTDNNCQTGFQGSYNVVAACDTGTSIQWSTDNGTTWSSTVPVYDEMNAQTVIARCVYDGDMSCASASSTPVTSAPTLCCPSPNCFDVTISRN